MTKIFAVIRHYNSFGAGVLIVSLHTDRQEALENAEEYKLTIPKRSRHLVEVQSYTLNQEIVIGKVLNVQEEK